MSLYSIAAASLTTPDDHGRRPVVDGGQIGRTLGLCLLVATALIGVHHRTHAADAGIGAIVAAAPAADAEHRTY